MAYAPINVEQMLNNLARTPNAGDIARDNIPAIAQGLLTPAPQSSADTMTAAAMQGANVANQQYAQQKQQQAIQQQAVMNNIQRRLAQGLLDAKTMYETGRAMYENGDTDETKVQGYMMMQQGAATGSSLRNSADKNGIDLSGFGSDVTLQQATQNFADDIVAGMNQLFNNDMSSDEYYDQIVAKLRKAGVGKDRAQRIAAEKAGEYQVKRLSRLRDGMQSYGIDNDNTINSDGVRIMQMMLQEGDDGVNVLANMYANPKTEYTTQVGRENAALANEYDLKKLLQQAQLNQLANDRKYAQSVGLAEYKSALADRNNYNNAIYRAMYGGGKNGSNSNSDGLSDSQQKAAQAIINLAKAADADVKNPDIGSGEDGIKLDEALEAWRDARDKGIFNEEQLSQLYSVLEKIHDDRQRKYGYK